MPGPTTAFGQVCNGTDETFDRDFWERRWAQVLGAHPGQGGDHRA
jgi:hypothetical protein